MDNREAEQSRSPHTVQSFGVHANRSHDRRHLGKAIHVNAGNLYAMINQAGPKAFDEEEMEILLSPSSIGFRSEKTALRLSKAQPSV